MTNNSDQALISYLERKKHTMSKKKNKKEIHQPDDKLFKIVMENKKGAAQYLTTLYPELAKLLDLSTLKIRREKHLTSDFKVFDADISWQCQFKKSKEKLTVSFLWENKSQPDEYIAIQVGLYLFLNYYKMVKTKGKKLEPIIPLIFYNGKENWTPKTIFELFQNHPLFSVFEKFLPNFEFHFTDITNVPKEKLLGIEMAFFRSAMIAMANKHNYDLLLSEFSIIFDLDEEDERISMGHYVFALYERLPEEVKKDIAHIASRIKSKIMSTLAILRKEGKIEGKIEGIELVLKIKELRDQGQSIRNIAKELNITMKEVKEILKRLG